MSNMKLNQNNYFDQYFKKKYMSVSQFKSFQSCPARTIAEINGEYERNTITVFLEGHYVEEALFGDISNFKENNPTLFSIRGKTKGELKSNFQKLNDVVDCAQSDKFFMEYITGDHQKIMTGEISGVPFKIMMDTWTKERIVDLKVMASVKESSSGSFIDKYGYDLQGAVYQEVEGNKKPFYLAVLTKEPIPNKMIIHIEDDVLEYSLRIVKELAPKFQAIKDGILKPERCEYCDYCKSTKKLTSVIQYKDFIGTNDY